MKNVKRLTSLLVTAIMAVVLVLPGIPGALADDGERVTLVINSSNINHGVVQSSINDMYGLPVDTTVTLTAIAETGFQFTGWFDGSMLISPNAAFAYTIRRNRTLTARFRAAAVFNVSVRRNNSAGGRVSGGGRDLASGTRHTVRVTRVSRGYRFDGWFDGRRRVSRERVHTITVNGNITLTARFSAIRYAVTFNANGGRITSNAGRIRTTRRNVAFNTRIRPPAARTMARNNHQFVGWYTAKKGGTRVTSSTRLNRARNITLFARWRRTGAARPPQTALPANVYNRRQVRPVNPAISLDRAIRIARRDLSRRGISATFHEHSGMDWERNQWVWELEFRVDGRRDADIEYYINVNNGSIVKFEWDD